MASNWPMILKVHGTKFLYFHHIGHSERHILNTLSKVQSQIGRSLSKIGRSFASKLTTMAMVDGLLSQNGLTDGLEDEK